MITKNKAFFMLQILQKQLNKRVIPYFCNKKHGAIF